MSLFSKKTDKELDAIVNQIRVDLSNNYKDNAVENIKLMEKKNEEKKNTSSIKDSSKYEDLLEHFKEDVKNFKRTY